MNLKSLNFLISSQNFLTIAIFTFIILFSPLTRSYTPREFELSAEISPCEDFYKYVCEPEISKLKMPPIRSRYTFYFADGYENYLSQVLNFLRSSTNASQSTLQGKQVSLFYQSCLNTSARKKEEIEISQKAQSDLLTIQDRNQLVQYWMNKVQIGEWTGISSSPAANTSNPKKWRMQVYIDWATLPEESYYENQDVVQDLKQVLVLFFKTLGKGSASKSAENVLQLERKFAKVMLSPLEKQENWDQVRYWKSQVFVKKYPIISRIIGLSEISSLIPIHQYMPEVYDFAENTMQTEDIEVLKDFFLFHFLRDKLDFAYPEWKNQFRKFNSRHLGYPQNRRTLEEECSTTVSDEMGRELAFEMVSSVFKNYPEDKFRLLVTQIREGFVRSLNASQWLSSSSKRKAIKKIESVDLALLYPRRSEDWRFPPARNYKEDQYLSNQALRMTAYIERDRMELRRERNLQAWTISPLEHDAFYTRAQNRFYFPIAFAIKPVFDPDRTELQNQAGIGSMIGHEFGHALDKMGSQYDAKGIKKSLFNKSERQRFEEASLRFIDHFQTAGHDGKLTLSENLADHMGLLAAYEASFPSIAGKNSKGKILEGLNAKKNFFIEYAKTWCTAITPERRLSHLKQDSHALPEARVNEQVKQVTGFYEAYQCGPGTKMFFPPEKRLHLFTL